MQLKSSAAILGYIEGRLDSITKVMAEIDKTTVRCGVLEVITMEYNYLIAYIKEVQA